MEYKYKIRISLVWGELYMQPAESFFHDTTMSNWLFPQNFALAASRRFAVAHLFIFCFSVMPCPRNHPCWVNPEIRRKSRQTEGRKSFHETLGRQVPKSKPWVTRYDQTEKGQKHNFSPTSIVSNMTWWKSETTKNMKIRKQKKPPTIYWIPCFGVWPHPGELHKLVILATIFVS